jgi:hypothetical protein
MLEMTVEAIDLFISLLVHIMVNIYTTACRGCPPIQEKLCQISLVALYIPYHPNMES